MRLDSGASNMLKEERKLGEAKIKGCSALSGELKTETHFLAIVCEFQSEQDTEKESFSLRGAVRMKRLRVTQKECERVKKKKETFFFAQVIHKENKLVEFSWSF